MTFKIIPIKPRRQPFNLTKFKRNATRILNNVNNGIKKDFVSTYPKPKYTQKKATSTRFKASTFSDDDILNFNVRGTRPHIIVPRRARVLRFQSGYRRKVTKGKIGRRSGGASGNTVFARIVRHPGQQGTDLDKTIAKKWQPQLETRVVKAIDQAANN